jgi:hypothetical protein
MITTFRVRLELARDDDGAVSDEGTAELTRLLTQDGAQPVLSRGDSGTVHVQLRIDARDDRAARGAAEDMLRDRANEVWAALALPPFTITFMEAAPEADPEP